MQFRGRRRAASFDVILHHDRGRLHAVIIDVANRGARVRIPDGALKAESDVNVGLHGKNYPARIVWCRGNHAGLAFVYPLPPEVLNAINPNMHRVRTTGSKRGDPP